MQWKDNCLPNFGRPKWIWDIIIWATSAEMQKLYLPKQPFCSFTKFCLSNFFATTINSTTQLLLVNYYYYSITPTTITTINYYINSTTITQLLLLPKCLGRSYPPTNNLNSFPQPLFILFIELYICGVYDHKPIHMV